MSWLPVLAIPFGLDLPPTAASERLEERFLRERLGSRSAEFLEAMLRDRLALLLLEDAQYMDEAITDLLQGLETIAGRQGGRNWILLARRTIRLSPPSPWRPISAPRLALCLMPLTMLQSARLVDLVTEDRPLPPHVAEEVVRRCGGSPLFLFALLETSRNRARS